MSMRIAIAVAAVSLLGATSAYAGKPVATGPVSVAAAETVQCAAVNISTKDLAEVVVSIYKANTPTPETGTTCTPLAPAGLCGVQSSLLTPGLRFCSVSVKGSTKSVRGRFCNLTTGQCAPLQ